MKIKQITYQHRRDFTAIMACEFCGHEQAENAGYDDRFYHDNVIPSMPCRACKKSTVSGGGVADATKTKYPEGLQL